jgi:hypothetical protein
VGPYLITRTLAGSTCRSGARIATDIDHAYDLHVADRHGRRIGIPTMARVRVALEGSRSDARL